MVVVQQLVKVLVSNVVAEDVDKVGDDERYEAVHYLTHAWEFFVEQLEAIVGQPIRFLLGIRILTHFKANLMGIQQSLRRKWPQPILIICPYNATHCLILVHIGSCHFVKVYGARSKDHVAHGVTGSFVSAVVKDLEAVLHNDTFVAVELIPNTVFNFIGPSPVELVNVFELLRDVLCVCYLAHLVQRVAFQ